MPANAPHVELLHFESGSDVPNNPLLPVVLACGAVSIDSSANSICELMEYNNWGGTCVYTVFDYHHYHPDAHEALCAATGWADIQLGGADGQVVRLNAGDGVVLPAGTGHKRVDSSSDFRICGAYPPGQSNYTTHRANSRAAEDVDEIATVLLPDNDPFFGPEGPLFLAWDIKA